MARKHEAARLLREGHSPSSAAAQMGVTTETVLGYLYHQVGEGSLRRSDILFSIPAETRAAVDQVERRCGNLQFRELLKEMRRVHPAADFEDISVYLDVRRHEVYMGDMYWSLSRLERGLHSFIRDTLQKGYGDDWWREGIPETIRAECAAARERDPEPCDDPYSYTTFIHLREVLEKRWEIFSKVLPPGPGSDRKRLLSDLNRLNRIRNRVMHPVKGQLPDERTSVLSRPSSRSYS